MDHEYEIEMIVEWHRYLDAERDDPPYEIDHRPEDEIETLAAEAFQYCEKYNTDHDGDTFWVNTPEGFEASFRIKHHRDGSISVAYDGIAQWYHPEHGCLAEDVPVTLPAQVEDDAHDVPSQIREWGRERQQARSAYWRSVM